MKVKDLIKRLQSEDQNKDVVFWHEDLDDNYWGCEINEDWCNDTDLIIYPTLYEEKEE
tara:strand:- start:80 stop:253 length:174 start_codon:yes stop_codon:yes gene_type:complete